MCTVSAKEATVNREGNLKEKEQEEDPDDDTSVEEIVVKEVTMDTEALTEAPKKYGFWERQAVRIARSPKLWFWTALGATAVLGVLGMLLKQFGDPDHTGWHSRGTLIPNRHAQLLMIRRHAKELLYDDDGGVWEDLIQNVQPGWEQDNSVAGGAGAKDYRRQLISVPDNYQRTPLLSRRLQEQEEDQISLSTKLAGCNVTLYNDYGSESRLWPVWKAKNPQSSFLNPQLLEDLCVSESNTQAFLEERNLCTGCAAANQCLPPLSLVLFARLTLKGGMDMSCRELAETWRNENQEQKSQADFRQCSIDLKNTDKTLDQLAEEGLPDSCPFGFDPSFVDEDVSTTSLLQYTSSIFFTTEESIPELYDSIDRLDKGTQNIEGTYDTQYQGFVNILAEEAVGTDMFLATASAIITTCAMLIHTRSPFLTVAGLLQILLSFPLAYFVYCFVLGQNFFPFLNFIGIFVVFALGADDVFVAVDKWKNFRSEHPNATTERVAAAALPDAAYAMLLTTSTTSVAFFGTAICKVAPIRVFAIFSGLLIFLDYVMVLVILFPCLCIYDEYQMSTAPKKYSWFFSFEWNQLLSSDSGESGLKESNEQASEATATEIHSPSSPGATDNEEKDSTSFIRRLLMAYYRFVHKMKWPLLAASLIAFVVATNHALKIEPPEDSEVRVLNPDNEYEHNYAWRKKLLSTSLVMNGGSDAYVIWGVLPADTGDQNDPRSWTQLVLDDTFHPSSTEAQIYLRDFCPAYFSKPYAKKPDPEYFCAFNKFDTWLQIQSNQTDPDNVWASNCNGASGLPMDPDYFDSCVSSWAQFTEEETILSYKGKVQVIFFEFASRVSFSGSGDVVKAEWDLIELDMNSEFHIDAPEGVSNSFFSSADFWYMDSTAQMYITARGSIMIALTAAAIVILISSKSLIMTLYSVLSVAYVLASVISMTMAAGWELGFLESICFAIAIGISVDFVIHFSHAYTTPVGKVCREERTKFALISMGPSILAAAFTTLAGASIMFFTTIQFFVMFAIVLFFTIIQATIGSFVFFLTLTNCIGPTQPTYFADLIASAIGQQEMPKNKVEEFAGAPKEIEYHPTESLVFDDITDEVSV